MAGEELSDDYVANLLKEDAKKAAKNYSIIGLGAYLPQRPTSQAPKPNTRFLRTILRDTDSHNQALLAKEAEESRARLRALRNGNGTDGRDSQTGYSSKHRDDSTDRHRTKRRRVDVLDQDSNRLSPPRESKRHKLRRESSRDRDYKSSKRRRDFEESEEEYAGSSRRRDTRDRRRREGYSGEDEGMGESYRRHQYRKRSLSRDELDEHDRRGSRRTDRHHGSRRHRERSAARYHDDHRDKEHSHRKHRRRRSPNQSRTPSRSRSRSRYRSDRKRPRSRTSSTGGSPIRSRSRSRDRSYRKHRWRTSSKSAPSRSGLQSSIEVHGARRSIGISKRKVSRSPSLSQDVSRHGGLRLSPPAQELEIVAKTGGHESDSDPLEDIVGPLPPLPPPKVVVRGRGAVSASAMDSHFSANYDPSADVALEPDESDDWEQALEALRDRQKYKQQHGDRLRAAGFTEEEIKKWEKGGEKTEEDVRWAKKGEGREWDRGKVVDSQGDVDIKAEWGRLKGT